MRHVFPGDSEKCKPNTDASRSFDLQAREALCTDKKSREDIKTDVFVLI